MSLTSQEITNILSLKNKGLSFREISQTLELPLSAVQYHLSKTHKEPRTKILNFPNSKFTIGELIGAFAGDGNYYHDTNGRSSHHRIRYTLSYKDDKEYAEYLKQLIKEMGLNPWILIRKKEGKPTARDVTFHSIKFFEFLKNYLQWQGIKTFSVCLKDNLNEYNQNFLFGFVRGAMDTDGSVGVSNLNFGVASENFTKDLHNILSLIGIHTIIKRRKEKKGGNFLYTIRINKIYLKTYNKYIGFSNPRKQQKLLTILNKNTDSFIKEF